jgi:nitronate monooxygenase/enoyl-[acyl-carrier protein] reductase II
MQTPVCKVLGIDVPVMQGSIGPWTNAELPAAVSEAGGLGSVGTALKSPGEVTDLIDRVRELTDRPFAVNFTARPFGEEAYAGALTREPAVVSFALGDPGDLVERAHAVGAVFVQQVHTVEQAHAAAERGVDVLIAQGGEAGGFGSTVGALALVPQVAAAVAPLPVLAAGGIADGRGLAAALVLGAQGVNIGTRFLASSEAAIDESWKRRIAEARSEEAVKVEFADDVFPPTPVDGYAVKPRVLSTPFVDEWNERLDEAHGDPDPLRAQLGDAIAGGRVHELFPFTGQSTGLIEDVLPAGEIVRRLVSDADELLRRAPTLAS